MVDADILRRKTEAVLHHVARLRREPVTAAALGADEDLRNIVLMDLQQAIQACIDLAVHACVDEGLGAPAGPAQALRLLEGAGHIDADLRTRLTGAAATRNIIVHQYGELDLEIIAAIVRDHLDDLLVFVAAVGRLGRGSGA